LGDLHVGWVTDEAGKQLVCFSLPSEGATLQSIERELNAHRSALGLKLAEHMSRALGGQLSWAIDADGATFSLRLPQRASSLPHVETPTPQDLTETLDAETLGEVSEAQLDDKPIVLVIDDSLEIHEYVERLLRRQHYSAIFAQDGRQGLWLAKQIQPAAILLDVVMPSMDGWSVLALLKQDPELAHIPVIIHSVIEDPDLAQELGAAAHLAKPITRERLLDTLERLRRR
jgi:CheY-like chemotaxis protein